jgi:hypothetical protein
VAVLLPVFAALTAELNTFGEAKLCSFVILRAGGIPVLFLGFVALPIVSGGTLIILPGGSVPMLLVPGRALVAFLTGLNMLVFPGVPVLLPKGGRAFVGFPGANEYIIKMICFKS